MTEAERIVKDAAEAPIGDMQTVITAHTEILLLHTRALLCHCECLGMNAENSAAVCVDATPPYGDGAYYHVMEKWGFIDNDGSPTI